MEHPFINDLSDKTLDELQNAISDLNRKLTYAYRTLNQPLINQLHMVIESYRKEHTKQMDELMKQQNIDLQVNIEKDN